MSTASTGHLQWYLEQCCMEYVAQVNGSGEWKLDDGEVYDVDFDVTTGPVELVRRSDEQRVRVDVSVAVWDVRP